MAEEINIHLDKLGIVEGEVEFGIVSSANVDSCSCDLDSDGNLNGKGTFPTAQICE